MTKERRLGRGLEALLGKVATQQMEGIDQAGSHVSPERAVRPEEPSARPASSGGGAPSAAPARPVRPSEEPDAPGPPEGSPAGKEDRPADRIDIRLIDSNPFQPRRDFADAELDSLSESLRSHGLLQPLVVRRQGERYQLIAGERRLRAAARAGWTEVPVQVIEADDRQTAELAIVENLQRKDLNPLEKAASFQTYLEQYACTQEELAARLKIDRSTVANLIRLLELPETVQDALRSGKITQGHGRALLPLGDEREQVEFCRKIQEEGLSVRKTESLVQETIRAADVAELGVVGQDGATRKAGRITSEHVAVLEQEFRAALGLRVSITHNSRGRGKLVVHFAGHEDFERLRAQICGVVEEELKNQAG